MSALDRLIAGRPGLTVIGDIHGDFVQMIAAVEAARGRNHGILFLGDLVNRGPYSIPCAALARRLVEAGHALVLPGNHEVRARLYLQGAAMTDKDRDRSQALIREVEADRRARAELTAFVALLEEMPCWGRLGDHLFAHAAVPAPLIACPPAVFRDYVRGADPELDTALDGERTGDAVTYRWLDDLPGGLSVYIGHDPQPEGAPPLRHGAGGARLHHLDYGCGRSGGRLRTLEIRADRLT